MSYTTWRKMIEEEMSSNKDSSSTLICTLTDEELNIPFDNGYGWREGAPFTAWTDDFVYFPLEYDGSESCGSVARNPNDNPTHHQGG
jgi:hypothetical protein